MNILFLTMSVLQNVTEHDIYQDLCRSLTKRGHKVYVVTPASKDAESSGVVESEGCTILQVRTGKMSGGSLIRKGIATVMLPSEYAAAIRSELKDVRFDLILYSTPPITLLPVVRKLKKQHGCRTYLMLKDIFPQNAVDLGMFGRRSPFYAWFRLQEKALYRISDRIGCMSPANVEYLCRHNPAVRDKAEICANALEVREQAPLSPEEAAALHAQYGIPEDRLVLVYGGNLGAPQDIPFIAKCLEASRNDDRVFFLIVGGGAMYDTLEKNIRENKYENVRLIHHLPREQYFKVMQLGRVGLVFLDRRFTIPNFPSRILSYMEYGMPVACVTDPVSDVGSTAVENGFGWYAESSSTEEFRKMLDRILEDDLDAMGEKARRYLAEHYNVEQSCDAVLNSMGQGKADE